MTLAQFSPQLTLTFHKIDLNTKVFLFLFFQNNCIHFFLNMLHFFVEYVFPHLYTKFSPENFLNYDWYIFQTPEFLFCDIS